MTHGTKFPLSARIVAAQRFLERIFDSSWAFVVSLFSKRSTPSLTNESTSPQHIPDTKTQDPQPTQKKRLVRTVEWTIGIVSLVLTVAGFFLSNAPKLSVDPSESVVSYSPLGTTFVLSNEGALEIHDVRASVANLHLENSDPNKGFQIIGMGEFTNVPKEAKAEILSPGHKMGLPYAPAFGFTAINNFTGGNLTIIVRYRPAYLWWHKKEIFPFQAIRTANGTWIWRSIPQ